MSVTFSTKYLAPFIAEHEYVALSGAVSAAHLSIHEKTGLGSEFLGWVTLPCDYNKQEFARIKAAAEKIKKQADILIVIGIGGSYLGARAAIEFLHSPFYNDKKKDTPNIYFVGNNISPDYLNAILSICDGKDIAVNIISKSGTTTEPALAFRIFRELLESKYGKEGAKERIYATTDCAKGTLKQLCNKEGYESFVIPDDIGGRFSVLTAVGLLPIAVSGANIDKIMLGAAKAQQQYNKDDILSNDAYKYAVTRNILAKKGKQIEITACYNPNFAMMNEWYKQLFGESEGKDNKGLFPASVIFSTDLHSMGQYIQEGARTIFQTVVSIKNSNSDIFIKNDADNFDGLNFLANQNMSNINQKALEGTILAHTDGGVPNCMIELDALTEQTFGELVYFYELACAMSGKLLGVNVFDQPGVESYKKNMFALLGKPGYEKEKMELESKLSLLK
ncbi:MAG: glucose-6-phosphate isomerase [Oscillospiraceae bacterium]